MSSHHRILMCPPDHFRVDYVINPWMAGHEGGLDPALARAQWQALRDLIGRFAEVVTLPPERRIVVDTLDAGSFACNAVNIDDNVIVNRASPALKQALEAAGFVVHEVGLSEFLKAGGSAKCLTLKLTEPCAGHDAPGASSSLRPRDRS